MKTYQRIEHADRVGYFLDCAQEIGDLSILEANIAYYAPEAAMAVDNYFQDGQMRHDPTRVAQICTVWLANQSLGVQRLWYEAHLHCFHKTLHALKDYYDTLALTRTGLNPEAEEVFHWSRGVQTAKRLGDALRVADTFKADVVNSDHSEALFKAHFLWPRAFPGGFEDGRWVQHEQADAPRPDALQRRQHAKRILKRAYKASDRFGHSADVRILFQGKSVCVDHPNSPFQYHFSLGSSRLDFLSSTAHGALTIKVTDKAGLDLFSNCVYIKDTPSVDQFLAFSNYIKQGLEQEMLRAGNLYGITELGYEWIGKLDINKESYQQRRQPLPQLPLKDQLEERIHSTRPGKRMRQLALKTLLTDLGPSRTLSVITPHQKAIPRYIRGVRDELSPEYHRTPNCLKARLRVQKGVRARLALLKETPTLPQ